MVAFLIAVSALAFTADPLEAEIQNIKNECGVNVHISDIPPTKHVTTFASNDREKLLEAANILHNELLRYPNDFAERFGLTDIYLCKSLNVEFVNIDGMSFSYFVKQKYNHSVIYLSIKEEGKLAKTLHHEFFHCIEYVYPIRDSEWTAINGDAGAYLNIAVNANLLQAFTSDALTPRKGFVTLYARTSPLEDRAELYAFMMTKADELAKRNDVYLNRKIAFLSRYLDNVFKEN